MTHVFRTVALTLWSAFVVGGQTPSAAIFWGALQPGPYAVGFRSAYQADAARSYDPEYAAGGKPVAKKPRPIFLAVWYPAKTPATQPMVYRDYLRAISVESPVPEFAQRLRKFTRNSMCEYMLGKEYESLSKKERDVWDNFLATPIAAYQNAPPAAGKFPAIVYHPGLGGTFEDDSVMFEYLASHGYVVVSSAYQNSDSTELNIVGDFYTSLDDLTFVSRFTGTLPFVDTSQVTAMGHSYGAQAVLAWRAQPGSPVDALVFLDSTVEYLGLEAPLFANAKSMIGRNRTSAVPVILFADRLRKPRFDTFDPYLSHAPRYEWTVDGQEHNDFISQGTIGESLQARTGGDSRKAEAARRNYDEIGGRILLFLDAYVKRDAGALTALRATGVNYKAPEAPEPTGRQLARMFAADSEKTRKLVIGLRGVPADVFLGAMSVLSEEGHEGKILAMLTLGAEVAPQSSTLQQALGDVFEERGDKVKAADAYRKALELLDGDSTILDLRKPVLRQQLDERLRGLR